MLVKFDDEFGDRVVVVCMVPVDHNFDRRDALEFRVAEDLREEDSHLSFVLRISL